MDAVSALMRPATPAASARRCSRVRNGVRKSTAVMCACGSSPASARVNAPVPQPMSATRSGAAGSRPVRRRASAVWASSPGPWRGLRWCRSMRRSRVLMREMMPAGGRLRVAALPASTMVPLLGRGALRPGNALPDAQRTRPRAFSPRPRPAPNCLRSLHPEYGVNANRHDRAITNTEPPNGWPHRRATTGSTPRNSRTR